ncbi:ribonuclease P protein component [Bacteroidota bacterium]
MSKNSFVSIIKKNEDFIHLMKNGKSMITSCLKAYWIEVSSDNEQFRLAIRVPKKKLKKAVDRNLIKRRIKEEFMRISRSSIGNKSVKINLLIVYNQEKLCTSKEINHSLNQIWKSIPIHNKNETIDTV